MTMNNEKVRFVYKTYAKNPKIRYVKMHTHVSKIKHVPYIQIKL